MSADLSTYAGGDQDFLDIATSAFAELDLPDVVTFAEDDRFLGKRLYPRQKTLLRLIYLETDHMTSYDLGVIDEWSKGFFNPDGFREGISPDIWDRIDWLKNRGFPHFQYVVNVTGRRGSKGYIGAICAAYQNWKMIRLDDPQYHLGIERGKEMYFYVAATSLTQAKQYQFADFANAVLGADCFRPYISSARESYIHFLTPADKRRVAEMSRSGLTVDREIASLRNHAISSNSRSGRGGAAFGVIFDEMAHMLVGTAGPRTAEELFKSLEPSLDQMGRDAFIYIPTSPYTKIGQAFRLYQQALQSDELGNPLYPEMLVVQLPSWSLYEDWDDPEATGGRVFPGAPQLYDEAARRRERREPDTFKVERRAQWAEVIDAYLRPEVVERMFGAVRNPETGEEHRAERREQGIMRFVYRGHADPAKSNSNFAAAIGHVEPIPDPDTGEVWDHVFIDWMEVWKAEDFDDHQIDYTVVEQELRNRIMQFHNLQIFSYDQYGSFVTVPQMRKKLRKAGHRARVKEVTFTGPDNKKRAEVFKAALGQNWVHAYRDDFGPEDQSLLELELKFLQEKNGKVDKQTIGPVRTKDLADAVMVVAESLLGDQLDQLRKREQLGSTQLHTGRSDSFGSLNARRGGGYELSPERQKLAQLSRRAARRQRGYQRRVP